MKYLDILTNHGDKAIRALRSFMFRNVGPKTINEGFLNFVGYEKVQHEPNIIFVHSEDMDKLKKFHGEVVHRDTIELDGNEYDLFIYNLESSNNCIYRPVYLGIIYHDGCFDFENRIDNYAFLFRNNLLHSTTFTKLVKNIKCSPTRYHFLHLAGYEPEGNFYSFVTHKFENLVTLEHADGVKYKIYTEYGDNFEVNLALDEHEFILPLTASARIRQRKRNLVINHSVYEQGGLKWGDGEDGITKGLSFIPSDCAGFDDFEGEAITLDQTFKGLLNDLMVCAGLAEDDIRDNLYVVRGNEKDIETAFFNTDENDWHSKTLVGRLAIAKEGDKYFITPLVKPTSMSNTILVYKLTSGSNNYMVCPSCMALNQVIEMIKDYFKLLDFDIGVNICATAGGGYHYDSFNLANSGHYRFNDTHVEDGIIVVKELTA